MTFWTNKELERLAGVDINTTSIDIANNFPRHPQESVRVTLGHLIGFRTRRRQQLKRAIERQDRAWVLRTMASAYRTNRTTP